jgi:predicted NACHT family NTPase
MDAYRQNQLYILRLSSYDALVQQSRSTVRPLIQKQCGTMQVLDMECPIDLTGDRGVYTNVNILEQQSRRRKPESREDCDFANRRVRQKSIPGLEAVEKHQRLMVLGKPGAGKSTFLKYLAMQCITSGFAGDKVPFFVRLKDFAEAPQLPSLLEYLAEGLAVEIIDRLLSSGRALIFLDGLDEVRGEDIKRIISEIRSITRKSDENQLFITCRIAAKEETFENFIYVEMADFDPPQMAAFTNNWFRARNNPPNAKIFLQRLGQNKSIWELAKTPILLTLLCLMFEIYDDFPENRVDLYEKGVDLLLQKWDQNQGVERDQISQYVDLMFIERLLIYIAFHSFTEQKYIIERRQLRLYIKDFIKISQQEGACSELSRIDCDALIKSIQTCHGLLVEQAHDTYSFSHLTFQEYFTAKNILNFSTKCEFQKLIEYIWEPRWQEIFLLVTEGLNDADYFLRSCKYQIDLMIDCDQNLQKFLGWGSDKTRTNAQGFESVVIRLSGAEKYDTQKLNTVTRENSILSANSTFFFKDAEAGGGLV